MARLVEAMVHRIRRGTSDSICGIAYGTGCGASGAVDHTASRLPRLSDGTANRMCGSSHDISCGADSIAGRIKRRTRRTTSDLTSRGEGTTHGLGSCASSATRGIYGPSHGLGGSTSCIPRGVDRSASHVTDRARRDPSTLGHGLACVSRHVSSGLASRSYGVADVIKGKAESHRNSYRQR